MKNEELIERLCLEVVCPAKGRAMRTGEQIILVQSNYRNRGRYELTIYEWHDLFSGLGLNFKDVLRELVKREFGEGYDVSSKEFSGYLGVTSNKWYELAKPKEEREG